MGKPIDERTKATALAMLATGASKSAVAREFGVSRPSISMWAKEANLPAPSPVMQQKRADLGEQLYEYLGASITALRSQLAVFADPAWIAKQPAGDLAILHGVIADKTGRLLAAFRHEQSGDDAGTGRVIDAPHDG